MAYYSNSSDGSLLDEQCAECPVGRNPDAPCPVSLAQIIYNYKQFTDGKRNEIADVLDVLIDNKTGCKMKAVMDEENLVRAGMD